MKLLTKCLILHLLIRTSAAQLERLDTVESCKPNEFYYAQLDTCKSCSALRVLFYGGNQEEWITNNDTVNISTISPVEDAIRRGSPEVEPSKFVSAGSEVLSRLIGLDEFQGQRYTSGQEMGSGSAASSDDDEPSTRGPAVTSNLITLDTLASEKFVERFIRSPLVREELLGSIEQCKYFQNSSACQMWSNLCVMSHYSQTSNPATSSTRSRINNQLRGTTGDRSIRRDDEETSVNGNGAHWWQQCVHEFNKYTICDSLRSWWRLGGSSINRDMSNIFALPEEDGLSIKIAGSNPSLRLNQPIQLLAYKYSLRGKFIGVDQFGLAQMGKFCIVSQRSTPRFSHQDNNFIRVGRNMKARCRFSTLQAHLLSDTQNETLFVDLYMAHQMNGNVFVKHVPVLIRNMLFNGMLVNQPRFTEPSRFKPMHRFFLSSVIELEAGEQVLVYAKTAHLDLNFKAHDRGAQLISMVLVLDYAQVPLIEPAKLNHKNSTTSNTNHLPEFETEILISQTLVDMTKQKMDFELTLTILSVVSCIWSLLKSYNILRYHGMVKMDLYSLIRFLFVSCDTLANLIAGCTLLFAAFLFFVFKFQQNTIHVMAPTNELDESILVNMKLALLFKTIGLSCKMFDLLNVDVFFVDWERPKMLTSAEIQNHLSNYNKLEANPQDANSHKNSLDPTIDHHKELSFWRPYAVVDRWLQLQTMRRKSLAFQLILFTCFNELIEFNQFATTVPDWSIWKQSGSKTADNQPELCATVSSSYRLLISATFYLLIALAQIVWHKYFYETMIRDKIQEFIDLCSIGNVSLFCMLYPRFGYYIHGRNANGSGDCSVSEMNGLLEREERGLCSRRGLVPNTDEQVFVFILPQVINNHYRKLLCRYKHPQQQPLSTIFSNSNKNNFAARDDNFESDTSYAHFFRQPLNMSNSGSFGSNRALIESISTRKRVINIFLANFLEHHYKDIDYSIKERGKLEGFLSDPELEVELVTRRSGALTPKGLPTVLIGSQGSTKANPATFFKDSSNGFTSVLWMGLEWDICLTELLCLLVVDHWLKQSLFISCIIVYSSNWLLKRFYQTVARKNVAFKALIDDKFLLRT